MEEDKMVKVDSLTYSAISEVIESCVDEKYLSNPGGLENLLPAFQKLQKKYPYTHHKDETHINLEDISILVKGLEYMVNTKDDWDILQISKSDGQCLIDLLKSHVQEIKHADWSIKLI